MCDKQTQKDSLKDTFNVLGIKEVVPKAYEDLLQPAAQELGKSLVVVARAVSIALAPVEGAVWGYDRIRSWLSVKLTQKLANTADEDIQQPPMNIAGPTIQNLTFAGEIPSLREFYANLLASSMDKKTASVSHPAFVRIIEELTPDEARILSSFVGYGPDDVIFHEVFETESGRTRSGQDLHRRWYFLCNEVGVEHIDNCFTYWENLQRLRLVSVLSTSRSELFGPGHDDRHGSYDSHLDQTTERSLYLTEFGANFVSACIDPHP